MIKRTLSNTVIFKLLRLPKSMNMTHYRLFHIRIIKELLLKFNFILSRKSRSWLGSPPIIRLGHNKTSHYLATTLVLMEIFRILNIFHIWNDRFRIKTMFFSCPKLFLRKLLTLHTSWLYLFKLCQITRTWLICLSRMMSNLWTSTLLLSQLRTLKLFYLFKLRESKKEIF